MIPLPPDDPDCEPGMNEKRSEWALIAIDKFRQTTGTDDEDAVADLIGDIAHYCDRHGVIMDDELRRAKSMYHYETQGQGRQLKSIRVKPKR